MIIKELCVQLIVVYKIFLDIIIESLVFVCSNVFIRGRLQAQAPAELGWCKCTAQDRQRHLDTPVTTTKAEKRGYLSITILKITFTSITGQ